MGFFDKAVDTFYQAGQELEKAGKDISQKANDTIDVARANHRCNEIQKKLENAYSALGEKVVKNSPEFVAANYPEDDKAIKALFEELEAAKAEHEAAKAAKAGNTTN